MLGLESEGSSLRDLPQRKQSSAAVNALPRIIRCSLQVQLPLARARERVHQKSHGSLRSAAARSIYSRTDAAATAASASPGDEIGLACRPCRHPRPLTTSSHPLSSSSARQIYAKKQVERRRNLSRREGTRREVRQRKLSRIKWRILIITFIYRVCAIVMRKLLKWY